MSPAVGDPDLADIGAAGLVDDFLQNLFRGVVSVETQIAVTRTRVDQDRVELKALLEHSHGQSSAMPPPAVASQKAVMASIRESGRRRWSRLCAGSTPDSRVREAITACRALSRIDGLAPPAMSVPRPT